MPKNKTAAKQFHPSKQNPNPEEHPGRVYEPEIHSFFYNLPIRHLENEKEHNVLCDAQTISFHKYLRNRHNQQCKIIVFYTSPR
ncbi:MAG: hypothetical protein WCJ39_10315 [bacterium]